MGWEARKRWESPMIFEFRRNSHSGKWHVLGMTGGSRDRFSAGEAIASLRAVREGPLPSGSYRVRAVDDQSHWRLGEIDRGGAFRGFIPQPASAVRRLHRSRSGNDDNRAARRRRG
jgi:hypothetical protein